VSHHDVILHNRTESQNHQQNKRFSQFYSAFYAALFADFFTSIDESEYWEMALPIVPTRPTEPTTGRFQAKKYPGV